MAACVGSLSKITETEGAQRVGCVAIKACSLSTNVREDNSEHPDLLMTSAVTTDYHCMEEQCCSVFLNLLQRNAAYSRSLQYIYIRKLQQIRRPRLGNHRH